MSETKSGMPSPALTEDDVRRIVIDVLKENERLNMERMLAPLGYAIVKQPDTSPVPELKKNIEDLRDRFENGVRYNEVDNKYVLVWTKKELDEAKQEANKIYNTFFKDLQQDTTGDQVECTDIQAEWVNSPTAD
jgi:hypothetical protein